MRPITSDDYDEINEALYDAICDGEGRARADHLIFHLLKRGFEIVVPDEPEPDRFIDPPFEESPDV